MKNKQTKNVRGFATAKLKAKMLYILAVPAIVLVACVTNETITKTVTVTFPAFTAGTTLNLTPTYTPTDGWEEFSESDITYTIISDTPAKTFTPGVEGFSGSVNISDGPYANFTTPVFTQIFKQNGREVGRLVIKVDVGGGKFSVLKNTNNVDLSPQAIPAVTLTLSK
jgi:hypothetical protein